MIIAVGLRATTPTDTAKIATTIWKIRFAPYRWPSLAPSITNPDTPSEYITIAVPTVVGGVLKLFTIPAIETGIAATLNDMSACAMPITIIGSQDARSSEPPCACVLAICRCRSSEIRTRCADASRRPDRVRVGSLLGSKMPCALTDNCVCAVNCQR